MQASFACENPQKWFYKQGIMAAGAKMARDVLLWIPFKVLQVTVAAGFVVLLSAQLGVAGLMRIFKTPAALRKLQAIWQVGASSPQELQLGGSRCPTGGKERSKGHQAPTHILVDSNSGHDSEAWKHIGPYMKLYGRHAIANSQLFNPEYIHFYLPGVGSLPYAVADEFHCVVVVATGEPLAPHEHWSLLTQMFLKEFPDAYFYHVTEEYATLLHDMGYYVNCCGTETTLQVQQWSYTSRTRTIRAAARSARDAGVRVRELRPEELTQDVRDRLQYDVTGCWRQRKAVADRDLRVFVRAVNYDTFQLGGGVRLFVAEAFDPAAAPPASVDPLLQGAALNAKPPKPPRSKSRVPRAGSAPVLNTMGLVNKTPMHHAKSQGCLHCEPLDILTSSNSDGGSSDSSSSRAGGRRRDAAAAIAGGDAVDCSCLLESPISQAGGSGSWGSSPRSSPSSDCVARVDCKLGYAADKVAAAAAAAEAATHVVGQEHTQDDQSSLSMSQQQQQQQQATPQSPASNAVKNNSILGSSSIDASGVLGPELVGFVLLDPLWQDGQEVGYVTSIMRMKRSAHQGTLKLLVEDIVSQLRKEGKKDLAFGFAPLYNMNDSQGRRIMHWMRWTAMYLFHFCNNVYAFKNLAYSKVRYGAGLNATGTAFNDPNVKLTYVYMAARTYLPGWSVLELFGFFKFVGICEHPVPMFLKLVGLKRGGENLK